MLKIEFYSASFSDDAQNKNGRGAVTNAAELKYPQR
jgi:hypothetical protein